MSIELFDRGEFFHVLWDRDDLCVRQTILSEEQLSRVWVWTVGCRTKAWRYFSDGAFDWPYTAELSKDYGGIKIIMNYNYCGTQNNTSVQYNGHSFALRPTSVPMWFLPQSQMWFVRWQLHRVWINKLVVIDCSWMNRGRYIGRHHCAVWQARGGWEGERRSVVTWSRHCAVWLASW